MFKSKVVVFIGALTAIWSLASFDALAYDLPSNAPKKLQASGANYSGNSGINPYDRLNSVPADELFIADTGGELDQYLYRSSSPLKFNIPITRYFGETANGFLVYVQTLITNKVVTEKAKLTLQVCDVDDDYAGSDYIKEIDYIVVNGYQLDKTLSSGNGRWNSNTFDVPIEWLKFPASPGSGSTALTPAQNEIEILIGQGNSDLVWAVEVDWGILEVSGIRPVVFVHGLLGSASTWSFFSAQLDSYEIPYFLPGQGGANDPISETGCIEYNGTAINTVVNEVLKNFGVTKVNLVTHSKGGLDARSYLRRFDAGGKRTQSLIQLATPNHGSIPAPLGSALACAARNLRPSWILSNFNYYPMMDGSDVIFVPLYNYEAGAVPIVSFIGGSDEYVIPRRSATLPWAVTCEQKFHGFSSDLIDCPTFKVNLLDAFSDYVTLPNVQGVDRVFSGINHSGIHDNADVAVATIEKLKAIHKNSQSQSRFQQKLNTVHKQITTETITDQSATTSFPTTLLNRSDSIAPRVTHTRTITVDSSTQAVFLLTHAEGTELTLSLHDPRGLAYIPQTENYAEGFLAKRFVVTNPIQGQWRLRITSVSATEYGLLVTDRRQLYRNECRDG